MEATIFRFPSLHGWLAVLHVTVNKHAMAEEPMFVLLAAILRSTGGRIILSSFLLALSFFSFLLQRKSNFKRYECYLETLLSGPSLLVKLNEDKPSGVFTPVRA